MGERYSISLDVETFSPENLTVVGAWKYAEHPDARILIGAWSEKNEPNNLSTWDIRDPHPPSGLIDYLEDPDCFIKAYNADSERSQLNNYGVRAWGIKPLPPEKFLCTQALGLIQGYPGSLARLADAVGIPINKDADGKRLMNMFSIPNAEGKVLNPHDHPEEFEKYIEYCRQDVRVEHACQMALPKKRFTGYEHRAWVANSKVNERGVPLDAKLVAGGIHMSERALAEGMTNLGKLTNNTIHSVKQVKELRLWFASQGLELPNLQAATIADALEREDLTDDVETMLLLRSDLGKNSSSKYHIARAAMCKDGRARGVHQAFGAHTGRAAGRDLQLQNFPRPKEKLYYLLDYARAGDYRFLKWFSNNKILGVLRDIARHMAVAPEGKVLHISDWNAIEARGIGWLAQDEEYLDLFKSGRDPYKIVATQIFNIAYEDVTDDQRFIAKQAVLGLGYSMSEGKFVAYCRTNKVTEAMASDGLLRNVVKWFRRKFRKIVAYWKSCEKCMIAAIRTQREVALNNVIFGYENGSAYITLPSGRRMWYPEAHVRMVDGEWGPKATIYYRKDNKKGGPKENWWVWTTTYGGKIAENITQGSMCDLVYECLIKLEDPKYNTFGLETIFHVHDELVALGPPCSTVSPLEAIMCDLPPWAEGLPIKAASFTSPYFKKE